MKNLISQKNARRISTFLEVICYLLAFIFVSSIVLLFLSRIQVNISTPNGYYENMLLSGADEANITGPYFSLANHSINLQLNNTDMSIDFLTRLTVILMALVKILPWGAVFLLLARFFNHIGYEKVFTVGNANLLTISGLIIVFIDIISPILNAYLIPLITNVFTPNTISVSYSITFSGVFQGAILIIMGYVFRYGIFLQEEVDSTV